MATDAIERTRARKALEEVNRKLDLIMKHLGIEDPENPDHKDAKPENPEIPGPVPPVVDNVDGQPEASEAQEAESPAKAKSKK